MSTDVSKVIGDILHQDVEAIVNAWNRNVIPHWLLLTQGVSGAVKRAAGSAPFQELARSGPMALGEAPSQQSGQAARLRLAERSGASRRVDHSRSSKKKRGCPPIMARLCSCATLSNFVDITSWSLTRVLRGGGSP